MVVWCDPNDETVIYWTHKGIKCKPEDVHKADLDALILAYEAIQNGKATEVIRCKDCKMHTYEEPKMVFCPNIVGSWMETDGYCSMGVKKNAETN